MANSPEMPPPLIPDYEVLRCIGQGAYGEVWLVRSILGTYRAAKIIRRGRFDHDRPFERELLGIRKFEPVSRTHPGLVAILHVGGDAAGACFHYIMEVADDVHSGNQIDPNHYRPRTLASELKSRGALPLPECLQVGLALSAGLGRLHECGLIHRDIKPSNIIFVDGVPKLADIGLVTVIGEQASYVGTAGFIPSEGPGSPTADIFSLGKVLYQMVTGKAEADFPDLPTSVDDAALPSLLWLNHIILKACEENPRLRYQSAAELKAALELTGNPEAASILATGLSWETPADDERLIQGLVRGLETARPSFTPATRVKLESIGGAVPLDSEYYVTRPTDHEFESAILRGDSIVLVKGARQMGKTSLLARGMQQARLTGARVVLTDLQKLNATHLASIEAFYLTLGDFLADQLNLAVLPEAAWDKRRSPNTNFERYLRREVLGGVPVPFVWALDEVDRLFNCPFGSEVFGLFRAWHNERALDPSGPWARLTLAMAYATEAHLFITDMNQSPFNVGTRLALDDFTLEQVANLNDRYGSPLRTPMELESFFALVGGQPYLVRRGLDKLAQGPVTFREFAAQVDRDEGIFGDHLRRMLVLLAKDAALTEAVQGVLSGTASPNTASFYRLRSAGILKGDTPRQAQFRCNIYTRYLRGHFK